MEINHDKSWLGYELGYITGDEFVRRIPIISWLDYYESPIKDEVFIITRQKTKVTKIVMPRIVSTAKTELTTAYRLFPSSPKSSA